MTRISDNQVNTELDQGTVTIYTAGTKRVTVAGTGVTIYSASATDQSGARLTGFVGGVSTVTAASAATAVGTLSLSVFGIAHGLAAAPTNFDAAPANTKAALASLLGAYVSADATNVYYNTTAAVTAASAYSFQWWASP